MRSARFFASALTAAMLLTVTACGGDSGGLSGGSGGGGGDAPKIAAVFSGITTDADYTFLGLQALQSAEKDFGAQTTLLRERAPSPTPSASSASTWPTATPSSGRTAASSTTPR